MKFTLCPLAVVLAACTKSHAVGFDGAAGRPAAGAGAAITAAPSALSSGPQEQPLAAAEELSADDFDADSQGEVPRLAVENIGRPTIISDAYQFTEGPVWDPSQQVLFFSDISLAALYRLSLPGQIDDPVAATIFLTQGGSVRGYDASAKHATSRIVRSLRHVQRS